MIEPNDYIEEEKGSRVGDPCLSKGGGGEPNPLR